MVQVRSDGGAPSESAGAVTLNFRLKVQCPLWCVGLDTLIGVVSVNGLALDSRYRETPVTHLCTHPSTNPITHPPTKPRPPPTRPPTTHFLSLSLTTRHALLTRPPRQGWRMSNADFTCSLTPVRFFPRVLLGRMLMAEWDTAVAPLAEMEQPPQMPDYYKLLVCPPIGCLGGEWGVTSCASA
jgi:hypothetical protein